MQASLLVRIARGERRKQMLHRIRRLSSLRQHGAEFYLRGDVSRIVRDNLLRDTATASA